MAEFVIECPRFGRNAEASTGFFPKKRTAYACGGSFKGLFTKKCATCSKSKDY